MAIVLVAIGASLSSVPAFAASDSIWQDGQDFTVDTIDGDVSAAYQPCRWTFASAIDYHGVARQRYGCLASGGNLSLFTYQDPTVHQNQIYGIRIGSDGSFRRLAGYTPHSYTIRLLPGADTLLVQSTRNPSATKPKLELYRLSDSPFTPTKASNGINVLSYGIDTSKSVPLLGAYNAGTPNYLTLSSFVLSQNRQYLAAWIDYKFIVTVDLETLETRAIATLYGGSTGTYSSPVAISDDGRYVYVDIKGYMYDTDGCGEVYDRSFLASSPATRFSNPCGYTNLSSLISHIDGITKKHHQYRFIDDDTALEFIHPYTGPTKITTIATTAYDPTRLDYLALGDSYSSGEGDIETKANGTSYYLPFTDLPPNNCHISSRSYPFLLRDAWGISPDKMKSVACSGAKVLPDYFGPRDNYYGQGSRILDASDIEAKRDLAIEKFIPGHVRQIEFVRKYQPKVITLTAGGNDVGFGDILTYCATPEMEFIGNTDVPYLVSAFTCDYAVKGSFLNTMMYDSIDTQGVYISRLIDSLVTESPESKIVLVGYPSFVASDPLTICSLNSATLDIDELRMINAAVSYMNDTLRAVAEEKGVLYVDIEDSLAGGRLCEGSEYMTGIADIGLDKLRDNDLNEIFHPNATGHEKISESVISANIPGTDMPNALMDPTGKTVQSIAVRTQLIEGEVVLTTSSSADVETVTHTFADGTTTVTTTFSEEIDLGTYSVDQDGALRTTLDLSSVPPGRHVLTIQGLSPSGETVTLYQHITVLASETDADGDGIPNDLDDCTFITSWYEEITGEDACSPVTESSTPDDSNTDGTDTFLADSVSTNSHTDVAHNSTGQRSYGAVGVISQTEVDDRLHDQIFATGDDSPTAPEGLALATTNTVIDDNNQEARGLIWPLLVIAGTIVLGVIIYARSQSKKH